MEWHQNSRRFAATVACAMVLYLAIARSGETGSWDWIRYEWLSAPLLIVGVAVLWSTQTWIVAGADWLRYGRRWVRTYELVSVLLDDSKLELIDSESRTVRVYLEELQYNRALWDLVYNGVLHSAQGRRLTMNRDADVALVLPTSRHIVGGDARPSNHELPRTTRKTQAGGLPPGP